MKLFLQTPTLQQKKLILAPMEGVMDHVMRDLITRQNHPQHGGYDQCVTEFIRITDGILPDSVFYKYCPELKNNSKTSNGTPVFVQLLGGNTTRLAENAQKAADLGACGIDLNFGCPAPTVNRHDGGASLLKCPDRILNIVSAVRKAVPDQVPVTAKIRLGFDDPSACLENARMIQEAGASWITVHCRTKTDGYKPPAHWEWINKIQEVLLIPIVVNGEIWSLEEFLKCQQATNQNLFMIGRGSISNPFLAAKIKTHLVRKLPSIESTSTDFMLAQLFYQQLLPLLQEFCQISHLEKGPTYAVKRLKQWLNMIRFRNTVFNQVFEQIKILHSTADIFERMHIFFSKHAEKEFLYESNSYESTNQSHHQGSLSFL